MATLDLDVLTDEREVVADIEGHDRAIVGGRTCEELIVRPPAQIIELGDGDDVMPETPEFDRDTR